VEEKIYEKAFTLLGTIFKQLSCSLDLDQILHIYLTGLTAGTFLGFSRAFVLFFDKDGNFLYGKKGIGPYDGEEARKIWEEIGREKIPIENFFENNKIESLKNSKFNRAIENIKIYLDDLHENEYLKRVVEEKKVFIIYNAEEEQNLPYQIKKLLYPSDLLLAPLISERGVIGVIFADNAFHRNPITEEKINFFTLISLQVSISIENTLKFYDLKNLQQKIIEMERLSNIGKFSLFITHEIRNPLITIGGFSKQNLETDDIEKIKRNSKIIYKEILRLEMFLNSILRFANIPPPNFQEVNLNKIINETIEIFEYKLLGKNLQVKIDINKEIKIKADPLQLKQVIFNIINNAIENTDHGMIYIKEETNNSFLKLTISDTGRGIAPSEMPYLATPFYTKKSHGIGLGLNIAKEIIKNHNGKIEIKSELNKGTDVIIYLPLEVKNEKENINN